MFAAYLLALTVLAICAVSPFYFFAVLLAGFPVSGLFLSGVAGMKARQDSIAEHVYRPEPTSKSPAEPVVNDQGLPVIKL
jgi:hypothetical protein